MSVTVRIPTPLQRLTGNCAEVSGRGSTVRELLENLEAQYPGLKERLCDEKGDLRRFVNVYVNEEDVRFLNGIQTQLKEGDEVSIIPAIAGGADSLRKEGCDGQATGHADLPATLNQGTDDLPDGEGV